MAKNEFPVKEVLAVGLVLFAADELKGLFSDPQPGGDVDPGGGDQRPATITAQDAENIAKAIYSAVWGDGIFAQPWERDAAFAGALMEAQVTNDVYLIMNAYGSKGTLLNPITLSTTVTAYLDNNFKALVNADYDAKNITLNWI